MKDSKLMKVLECCTKDDCVNCPTQVLHCKQHAMLNALDIIKRQKEEIDRLQSRIVFWREDMDYHPERERKEAIKEVLAEIDALVSEHKTGFISDWYFYEKFDELKKKYMEDRK